MEQKTLDMINRFTRRAMKEDELYVFPLVLCDNDIDRDGECFSDEALEQLREAFVGKTGIFDHDPSTSNQTARIFDTEVVAVPERKTKYGAPYKQLRASAYMVRTEGNSTLIAEIDAGIKKEVSISCAAAKKTCSVCGCDRASGGCAHKNGRTYAGKHCYTVLSDITDAYEWSFVAVPAQVSAGVTKRCTSDDVHITDPSASLSAADDELRRDICRLAFFAGGRETADAVSLSVKHMDTAQLIALKKSYESRSTGGITLQLVPGTVPAEDPTAGFTLR
ncbi:MAG: hypothetical protein IJM44_07715 [Ruminococcus sp.]|nr:hypothetical protein [Ruminococcus sp.]